MRRMQSINPMVSVMVVMLMHACSSGQKDDATEGPLGLAVGEGLYRVLETQNEVPVQVAVETDGSSLSAVRDELVHDLGEGAHHPFLLPEYDSISFVIDRREALDKLLAHRRVIVARETLVLQPAMTTSRVITRVVDPETGMELRYKGENTAVVVIDSGVGPHTFYRDKIIKEFCCSSPPDNVNGLPLCAADTTQSDILQGPGAASNCLPTIRSRACEHGNFMAGVIAGKDGQDGDTLLQGIAPEAELIPMQVGFITGNTVSFSLPGIALALEKAVALVEAQENGMPAGESKIVAVYIGFERVTSASVFASGNETCNFNVFDPQIAADLKDVAEKINTLHAKGIAVVAPTGNLFRFDQPKTARVSFPACLETVTAVGSIPNNLDRQDEVSINSRVGLSLDLFAPGGDTNTNGDPIDSVRSSSINDPRVPDGEESTAFANRVGTSIAAAHVAASIAVLQEVAPCKDPTDLVQVLKDTGVLIEDRDTQISRPRLDLKAAVEALEGACEPVESDVAIKISPVNLDDVIVGDEIDISVELVNNGPSALSQATVQISPDIGINIHTVMPTNGSSYNPALGIWNLATPLDAGASAMLFFKAEVLFPRDLAIQAELLSSTPGDTDASNNQVSMLVPGVCPEGQEANAGGTACVDTERDTDGDGTPDETDVCPGTPDDQSDSNNDGVGDACLISRTVNCVTDNGDGTLTAEFGYTNTDTVSRVIPIGERNRFNPAPWDRGQITEFKPGKHSRQFKVTFNKGGTLVWILLGGTATASSDTKRCF